MLEYYTLGACFIDPAEQEVKAARAQVRKTLGDDVVKAGWTYPNSIKVLEILGENAVNRVRGSLRSIKAHVNKDERTGNEYQKIRIELVDVEIINTYKNSQGWQERAAKAKALDGAVILSLDAGQEMAHRLVAKLGAVKPGERVTISPFAEPVDRNGRTFINHVLSVKSADGEEVRGKDYFTEVRTKTRELEERLKGLGLDDKSIKEQVRRQKTKAFMEIADTLGANLPDIVPTRARDAEAGKPEASKPESGNSAAPAAASAPAAAHGQDEAADEPIW